MEQLKNKDLRNTVLIGGAFTILIGIIGLVWVDWRAGLLCLLSGVFLLAVFLFYTLRRYGEIESLNAYLVRVLAGAETPEPEEQEEGEISILRTNICKAASTLIYQNEQLRTDKLQLAEAIADISHQLKTPLTSMMVMNDLLQDETEEEKREEFLRTQSVQLGRMNWLIQTLLKLSKLDAGMIEIKQEAVSAKELTEAAMKLFAVQCDLKSIECDLGASNLTLRCDRNWTLEAVQNIIKNCIEHMEVGGKLSVTTQTSSIDDRIIIKDTGCGIAKEDLPHIFERFYRGKNAGKDSVGIGLALAKTIMEMQHGDILVESEEGVGTTFTVKFYKTII